MHDAVVWWQNFTCEDGAIDFSLCSNNDVRLLDIYESMEIVFFGSYTLKVYYDNFEVISSGSVLLTLGFWWLLVFVGGCLS